MPDGKKPRGDAKLAKLPGQIQAGLRDLFVLENGTYKDAKAYLAQFGITTNDGALGKFYDTHCATIKYSEARRLADEVKAAMDKNPNVFDEATKGVIAQRLFDLAVAKDTPAETIASIATAKLHGARLELDKQKLGLQERRIVLLEKKAAAYDEAKGIFEDKTLTPEQREQMMREKFGL